MPPLIRVLVLHNNPRLYATLRKLCATTPNLQLIGEVTDVIRLPDRCRIINPHVLVVIGGIRPFVFDISSLTQQIDSSIKVFVILSAADRLRADALHATQIAGCIFEHEISTALIHLLRTVAAGGTAFSGNLIQTLLPSVPDERSQPILTHKHEPQSQVGQIHLTQREQEVLQLLAQGFSNKAIAQTLTLSEKTIEFHLKNLFEKLNVTSRTAAVLAAQAYNLIVDH